MNKNNLEFDVVSVDQNNLQSLVVFEINQVSSVVRKTNVGQFVKSCPFELNFPTSIGKSKWVVILFPNGQYEAGRANDLIYIYLRMVHCEYQSAEFKFDVKFQLGSEYATVTKKDVRLCFDNVKTRWIGTKLLNTNEMIMNGSQFIHDDILLLSVNLNEHSTKHVPSAETSYNSNFWFGAQPYMNSETEPDVKLDNESYVKSETRHTDWISSRTRKQKNLYQSNTAPTYDIYQSNQPQRSHNEGGSTNVSNQASRTNGRNQICDSNLNEVGNMVENEFSDGEDIPEPATNSITKIASALKSFFKPPKSN